MDSYSCYQLPEANQSLSAEQKHQDKRTQKQDNDDSQHESTKGKLNQH